MGFDLDLFVGDVDESYICWICKKVLDNPLATPCGHVFCSACAIRRIIDFCGCPRGCYGRFTIKELNHVQPLLGLIGKLLVKCPNVKYGCTVAGPLQDSRSHALECEFELSDCNAGCLKSGEVCSCTSSSTEQAQLDKKENMEELRKRAIKLEEEVATLKRELYGSEHGSQSHNRSVEKIIYEDHREKDQLAQSVNGQDLSGASHEVAAETFQNAPEPITVVLRRTVGKKSESAPVTPRSDVTSHAKATISTQTTENAKNSCFCRFLMENCRNASSPLSALIMSELMRFKDSNPAAAEVCDIVNHEAYGESFPTEDEDEIFEVDYEEIVLKRPSSQDKLGIMLCDNMDDFNNCIKVVVSEVAPDSIAARCQKIREGDQIVKINGSPVHSMNEASKLLHKDTPVITFLIAHPRLLNEDAWQEDDEEHMIFEESLDSDDVLRDVTNCTRIPAVDDVRSATEESRQLFLERRPRDATSVEYAEIVSQKMTCDKNGTTESGISNTSSGSNHTNKDSGIGRTMDSNQSTTENNTTASTDTRLFGTAGSSGGSSGSHSIAREFTYVQPQNYHRKKRTVLTKHKLAAEDSTDSAKGSLERSIPDERNSEFHRLSEAIQNLELDSEIKPVASRLPTVEDFDAETNVSPWVRIARQDYEDKMRQLEKVGDFRNLHPAMASDGVGDLDTVMAAMSSSRTPSVATDNTSSAYSTGESFRSSSTASDPRIQNELITPPLSPGDLQLKNKSPATGVTMTYYMSSDANSDGEGPACYLTHNEDSESEGFEDAGLEFSSSMFTSIQSVQNKPVPLPRILHPPHEATSFMSHSLTSSTKQLWKAAAAVARSRRHPAHPEISYAQQQHDRARPIELPQTRREKCRSPNRQRPDSRGGSSSKDRSESETVIAANCINSGGESTCTNVANETECYMSNRSQASSGNEVQDSKTKLTSEKSTGPRVRRSSEYCHPRRKHPKAQRSHSCTDAPNIQQDKEGNNSGTGDGSSNGEVRMEWKVRVSKDGTRYITKRPVREKVLRHREQRLLAERCGITTDDDVTELKLGRHWSRDERKRHMRLAREKRRRRDFMQRCRLEVLNENAPADGEIVELSHKKMTRQKHKRMLLDNFVTVQEILAHGDRSNGIAKLNPLLSVTYI